MQTPVPLQIPFNSIVEGVNGWLPTFVPLFVIGLALALLMAFGALLLYFLQRGKG